MLDLLLARSCGALLPREATTGVGAAAPLCLTAAVDRRQDRARWEAHPLEVVMKVSFAVAEP
jgi:hypothetical protein